MRTWFSNRSIRFKVTLCLLFLALSLLISSTLLFLIKDISNTRTNLQHTLATIGTLLAVENVATLEFDDSPAATENLANLKAFPSIVTARIFREDGSLFATYPADSKDLKSLPIAIADDEKDDVQSHIFIKNGLIHFNIPIISEGTTIGSIYIADDQREIKATIRNHIQLTIYISAGLLFLSLITSMYLGRILAGPIQRLSEGVADVARNRDFSRRVQQESHDEVGELVAGFNHMLGQLESRDKQLAEYQRSLEDKVRERTARIEDEKHRAELANHAKSQFLASMSHEIRTPMNGILGMANLLAKTEMSPRQIDFLTTIHESGESLLVLISDILDLSKIESGKIEIEDMAFDPALLVEQTMGMFAAMARKKRIELVTAISPHMPAELIGDMQRIRQVLTNLIGNAIKFTEKGQILVRCQADIQQQECHLLFSVEDTGIGIRKEALDTIFDSFIQADGSTTRKYGGTGLGLSISRQLMEAMGGSLTVTSKTGKGSVFTMHLVTQIGQAGELFADKDLHDLHIGIIMDSDTNRLSFQEHLVHWGASVHGFSSSKDALSHLSMPQNLAPFDLLLVNRKMAFMDGTAFTATLRELRKNLPPILLMTCIQECDKLEKRALFDDFIFKPLRRQQLHTTVLNVLGRSNEESTTTLFYDDSARRNLLRESNLRLLIAEDSKVNRDVLLGMLEDLGLKTEVARNGVEAVELYQQKSFDLIFMDCQMPLMDGYETSQQIRLLEAKTEKHIPIVALTANALSGDRQKALDSGMDDYLAKPFRQEQLIDTLYSWTLGSEEDKHQSGVGCIFPLNRETGIPIDISVLKEYQDMDDEQSDKLLQLVVTGYLLESECYIKDLNQAVREESCIDILNVSHKFKSASGQAGAICLMHLLATLEQQARDLVPIANMQHVIADIRCEYRKVSETLPTLLKALLAEME